MSLFIARCEGGATYPSVFMSTNNPCPSLENGDRAHYPKARQELWISKPPNHQVTFESRTVYLKAWHNSLASA